MHVADGNDQVATVSAAASDASHDHVSSSSLLTVPLLSFLALTQPFAARTKLKGRIHVCSKSLVFDPDDQSCNITRLPFREVASMKPRKTSVGGAEVEYFVVHTRLCVEIPSHASYVFHKYNLATPQSEFILSLSYVDTATVLEFVGQLHGLYRLSASAKPAALASIIRAREEAITFESSAIADIRERVLLPGGQALLAQQVQPLLLVPGRLQLTDARVYFQSFNHVSSEATSRVDIADIKRIYKRRLVMRDTALEMFLPVKAAYGYSSPPPSTSSASTLSQTSVYFNFASKAMRDMVYELITTQERFAPLREQSLTSMTSSWMSGATSNFEYLLFLNQQAGRSWMDLTQYPVMPWVIQDYTSSTLDLTDATVFRDLSKPVGALNPERLAMLQKRMRDMPPEISHGHPFLYGTHYSSPGYVLYYLARKAPQYMLRLQSGKYDQPDRLFHSIASSWTSVLSSPTDVKELIPEFYASPDGSSSSGAAGEFLLNVQELDLGVRQNGQPVEDVTLPPWARSATDFLRQMRAALESEHVSAHLHEWIDLIFGCKQKVVERAHNAVLVRNQGVAHSFCFCALS
jgi:factor associated with neutral sphingomyelinase activation